ncbi:hypothetical protein SYK_23240 [Pseudodesulfovibrio nedwellii]|uniref:Type II secretion system protein GspN n=2 Tax=Pseudodesulfovibrio nedwellii TaxID=2973072 RepID=A0ABN6S4L8_9BACT|nr:hypothetical protein [Pseudodesulfovibrio sp.]BDQ37964.1 hypothetical protein SYK_23240 [Pseudodesulfovibrio nedwellii]
MKPSLQTNSSLPGRILVRFFLIMLGFLIGIALFTPWDKIWASALTRVDEQLPSVGMTWEGLDRDGPFSFRVRDFKVTVAQTPGALHFKRAYVTMGFSPLATVRLDTGGPECTLELFSNGVFEFEGDLNLTYLLGFGDFKGTLRASGSLFLPDGAKLPHSGWVDIRSQRLVLPGDKSVEDFAFTAEIENEKMNIRDFSMMAPIMYKSTGSAIIDPNDLFRTTFTLTGEMTVGRESFPYPMQGTLADAIW